MHQGQPLPLASLTVCGCVWCAVCDWGGGTDKYKAQGPASMPHLWPPMASPKGTPRVHQCHWQCTKRSSLQPMPMLITTPSPGQLPWCTRQYHHKACSKTGLEWPGTIPTCNDHGPLPCPRQAGCNTKGITKQKCMPQSISQANRAKPLGAPPTLINHSQPQKWGWLVLPIVLWRH